VYILPACSQVQERSDVVPTLLSLPYPSKSKQNVHQEVSAFEKSEKAQETQETLKNEGNKEAIERIYDCVNSPFGLWNVYMSALN